MIKMNTLTSTRQSKIHEMIDSFQPWDGCSYDMEGEYQLWQRQVGPVWKLMKRWELKEAMVFLELALWKCRLKPSNAETTSRAVARIGCGADVIINEVVQFLSHGDFEAEIFAEIFDLEGFFCFYLKQDDRDGINKIPVAIDLIPLVLSDSCAEVVTRQHSAILTSC